MSKGTKTAVPTNIDDLIKTSLDLNYKVRVIEDDKYINFGTPSLIKDFIFWEKYFKNDR